jgi:hypothetical protein
VLNQRSQPERQRAAFESWTGLSRLENLEPCCRATLRCPTPEILREPADTSGHKEIKKSSLARNEPRSACRPSSIQRLPPIPIHPSDRRSK